jgi:hypothetical protein
MARRIVIAVDEVDADAARLETLSLQLREELRSTGTDDDTRLRTGEALPGTRNLDHAATRALVVCVAEFGAALCQVGAAMRRGLDQVIGGRTVELTLGGRHLPLTDASTGEQPRLVNSFLEAAEP